MLRFLCPNGHKVHCSDDQAGRPAKCPQCGVRFRVPVPGEATATEAPSETAGAAPPKDELAVSADEQKAPRTKEPEIEFLCPNGHRLHGPASLQGKPGQCPECGSKFRIPTYDELEEDEQPEQELGVGHADGTASDIDLATSAEPMESEEPALEEEEADLPPPELEEQLDAAGSAISSQSASRWGSVVRRLWRERSHGAVLEICLENDETIVPDHFVAALSDGDVGVFAIKSTNGSYTIQAVPWTAISQVVVRGVKSLPGDLRS